VAGILDAGKGFDPVLQNFERWFGDRIEVRLWVERRGRWPPQLPNRHDVEPTTGGLFHSLYRLPLRTQSR